ncbi:MAG TPA: beta-ketoacyl-ACP synthase II [Cyclobacteriaceae bacterium]|nr:beta-ketoacyl-ACP synthase II [Cyclobacteriaceae bacterium]HMV11261.1 beta-ketoacyl-ACP synthase II [Cyclobacteriaceae bacterium]HMV91599.1 beta-ketoacyl-ACP synthase II [Cyclobacteriaceae bacterium]HMX01702.1 beta-ketoacyl-ACP synthase II [Cyclobacteriaceae bacterium]HMX51379.1 beta-ketoacyl-ACP synthase II [Cyclobacteriaceae bacterium]
MQRRVVVTGLGALAPLGNTVPEFWNNLIAGKSGAAPITRFDTTKFKTKFACELKGYDPLNYFEKAEVRKYDPFAQYALASTQEALADSGLNLDTIDKTRVGVIWGSGNGGFQTFQNEVIDFAKGDGTPRLNPFFIPKVIVDIASGWISIKYGFMGPNFTTVSACATSTTAIIDAMNYIRWGKADIIVTGGSEAAINEAGIGGFNALKALSTRNDDPVTASRPFDVDRDGFVMGEGSGTLILEEYEHAKRRGAKIYAEVAGGGMSADAFHITATHPEGKGAQLGMKWALEDAGLAIQDVDYLNPHATSTPKGDESEMKAVASLFGDHSGNVLISATKSSVGHMLGAAGAIEAIICIKAIQEGVIPPTINTKNLDPDLPSGLNIVTGSAVKKDIRVAMSNTFGFGGHNATAVFRKAG